MPLSMRIFIRTGDRRRLVGERVLEDDRVTVGRSPDCTLALEDPNRYLSRLQAEFERTGRGYLLRVMSRTLPVIVNGVQYFQGSEVTVHAGDLIAMDAYDLEVVSVALAKASPAAPRPTTAAPPPRRPAVEVRVQSPLPRPSRTKWVLLGGAVIVVVGLAALFPVLKGMLPDPEAQKKAEQAIARLEGNARSLLKLAEGDRRDVKEATAASAREIERVEGLVRSTRTSQERLALDALLVEARRMARASAALEDKVREQIDGPAGLPSAEGNLNAAATAARGGDRVEAIRLLEGTVASLTALRTKVAEERKAVQADQDKRREQLLAAETRALADAEARARAEAEAKAKAKAKADAEAEARARADADKAKPAPKGTTPPPTPPAAPATPPPAPAPVASPPDKPAPAKPAAAAVPVAPAEASACLGKLSGAWAHSAGGTWTFEGGQGTRVVESTHYGPRAQEITVLALLMCDSDNLTYRIVRQALVNTGNPAQAFDKTPASEPGLAVWEKVYTQRYAVSGAGLRFGSHTFAKR